LPLQPSWQDIAVRLALTMLAAGIIGFDREARGHDKRDTPASLHSSRQRKTNTPQPST
jgi:hypothetical protein